MNEKASILYDEIYYRGLTDISQLDELLESLRKELIEEWHDNYEVKYTINRVFKGTDKYKLSRRTTKALDAFLLENENITEEERKYIQEKVF